MFILYIHAHYFLFTMQRLLCNWMRVIGTFILLLLCTKYTQTHTRIKESSKQNDLFYTYSFSYIGCSTLANLKYKMLAWCALNQLSCFLQKMIKLLFFIIANANANGLFHTFSFLLYISRLSYWIYNFLIYIYFSFYFIAGKLKCSDKYQTKMMNLFLKSSQTQRQKHAYVKTRARTR